MAKFNQLKIINGLVIFASLVGYLEWGKDNHQFLAQAELEVISKLLTDPLSVWHPFTLLPMAGQIILIITLFQSSPSRRLTTIGIACLGILIVFMFLIGLLGMHFKIIASTLPFVVLAIIALRMHYKK
ncbi:MAG: hypothetical protein HOP30_02225 [Cyclobacteriaceae bacterium]|nr:hypothetical protein [Cyclobacteriaceae bacterium]